MSVHAHCTEREAGSERQEEANEVGGGIGIRGGNGDGNGVGSGNGDVKSDGAGAERERERGWRRANKRKMETGTGEEETPTRVIDAMWETGEIWAEREKNVIKKGLVQLLPTQIIERIARKQGGKHKALRA